MLYVYAKFFNLLFCVNFLHFVLNFTFLLIFHVFNFCRKVLMLKISLSIHIVRLSSDTHRKAVMRMRI